MTFLDYTYFQGEEGLPNLVASPSATGVASFVQAVGETNLNWFIAKYETLFLKKLLGYTLYKNFMEGIQAETPLEIWIDLRDLLYWEENGYKFSPAANYVYYWIKRSGRKQTAIQGDVIGTLSHADNAQDAEKMIKAWNDMCDMILGILCFFRDKKEVYKDYWDCFPCGREFIKITPYGI